MSRSCEHVDDWPRVVDAMLAEVGWTLRRTGFQATDVEQAQLIPADSPDHDSVVRGAYVALDLRGGARVNVFRDGIILPPTTRAQRL